MLIFDFRQIGERLFHIRKSRGLTQADVAERAGLSDRTYADIERGSANMRLETLLKICAALAITPNDILLQENPSPITVEELLMLLSSCPDEEKRTALKLLDVYVNSVTRK